MSTTKMVEADHEKRVTDSDHIVQQVCCGRAMSRMATSVYSVCLGRATLVLTTGT